MKAIIHKLIFRGNKLHAITIHDPYDEFRELDIIVGYIDAGFHTLFTSNRRKIEVMIPNWRNRHEQPDNFA